MSFEVSFLLKRKRRPFFFGPQCSELQNVVEPNTEEQPHGSQLCAFITLCFTPNRHIYLLYVHGNIIYSNDQSLFCFVLVLLFVHEEIFTVYSINKIYGHCSILSWTFPWLTGRFRLDPFLSEYIPGRLYMVSNINQIYGKSTDTDRQTQNHQYRGRQVNRYIFCELFREPCDLASVTFMRTYHWR